MRGRTRWWPRACTRGWGPSRPTATGSAWVGTAPPTRRASFTAPNRRGMTDNLRELAGHISSPLFFTHIRAAIGSAVQQTNCHPFRHDRWLFMHNGYINEFATVKRDLVLAVDPSLYPGDPGQADTEVLFYLALTLGLEDDPPAAVEQRHRVRRGGRRAPRGAAPVSGHRSRPPTARRIWAFRYSSERKSRSLFLHHRRSHAAQALPAASAAPRILRQRAPDRLRTTRRRRRSLERGARVQLRHRRSGSRRDAALPAQGAVNPRAGPRVS